MLSNVTSLRFVDIELVYPGTSPFNFPSLINELSLNEVRPFVSFVYEVTMTYVV